MEFFNSALGKNITFVRPAYFIISGFIGIPNMKYYYVFLFFVYVVSVVGNTAVITLIYLDHNLRTPKYIAVLNLAFVDLLGNSALVPKIIDLFLFNHPNIGYADCLTFLFFCYSCLSLQSLNLVALSCDRLIAIMYPLHYQAKMTQKFMLSLIIFFWLFVIVSIFIAVGLLTRLSFCNSVVINSYFCDHGQIYRLGCNDTTPSLVYGRLLIFLFLGLPLMFITVSYACIGYTLSKVATLQEKMKAFKTCTAHLSLVTIYFLPQVVTFSIGANIDSNARIINLSLTSIFPPMLNPIIYVLQTQEIKVSIRKIFKKTRKKTKIRVQEKA